jgi:hypothetical protein
MKKIVFLLLLVARLTIGYGQNDESISMDLAQFYDKEISIPIPAGLQRIDKIILINAFLQQQYTVSIEEEVIVPPPLSLIGEIDMDLKTEKASCPEISNSWNQVTELLNSTDVDKTEMEISGSIKTLKAVWEQYKDDCSDPAITGAVLEILNGPHREVALPVPLKIESGKNYKIIISRGDVKWICKLNGRKKGSWEFSYGFLFSPKGFEPSRYYLNQTDAESYIITPQRGYKAVDLRFTPMVFYNYFFESKRNKNWNHSFNGGIGYNTESAFVSLGYGGTYNHNIGFSTGIVFYEQEQLMGHYHAGKVLTTNLEPNQLHEKAFFRPNFYVAFMLRLGKNPFEKTEE